MSKLETFEIEYKGNKYLATEVENIFDPESNDTIILASSRLNDVLVDKNGKFVDHEAEFVDEQIYAFVDDKYFSFTKEEFIERIIEDFD
ncbi:MAG: hypothetical protein IK032_00240 [Bacteroidales bacterium]|nr:hypothetical protein [Bacteroidales bacterium]MBR5028880.1 hypothetical protein [Bacteroidales bacterium]